MTINVTASTGQVAVVKRRKKRESAASRSRATHSLENSFSREWEPMGKGGKGKNSSKGASSAAASSSKCDDDDDKLLDATIAENKRMRELAQQRGAMASA